MLWHHLEKRRYYRVYVQQDLWGNTCMIRSWGSLDTAAGNYRIDPLASNQVVSDALNEIGKRRRQRNYIQVDGLNAKSS